MDNLKPFDYDAFRQEILNLSLGMLSLPDDEGVFYELLDDLINNNNLDFLE